MNCTSTNQNTNGTRTNEVPPLKARCNRIGIHVPGDNPTPAEIIPIIERRLAAHMNHVGRTGSEYSGDFVEWKLIHDEYHEFLQQLRATDKFGVRDEVPLSLSAQNAPNLQSSPSTARPADNYFSGQKSPGTELPTATEQPTAESKASSAELLPSCAEFTTHFSRVTTHFTRVKLTRTHS